MPKQPRMFCLFFFGFSPLFFEGSRVASTGRRTLRFRIIWCYQASAFTDATCLLPWLSCFAHGFGITVSVIQKEISDEVPVGFSSSLTTNGTYGTSAHLICQNFWIDGSPCVSPRAAESPTLVLIVTGFGRSHQENMQERRKGDLVLPSIPRLKLCKVWARGSAWSSSRGPSRPRPFASCPESSRSLRSPMAPAAVMGARTGIRRFRAEKPQIIKGSPLGGQNLPPGWDCS